MKKMNEKKQQTTVYLTEEDRYMIKRMRAKSLLLGENATMTDILHKIIKEVYDKEFKKNES
jgi:hypothetical protein